MKKTLIAVTAALAALMPGLAAADRPCCANRPMAEVPLSPDRLIPVLV